jgi:hypothetical protein
VQRSDASCAAEGADSCAGARALASGEKSPEQLQRENGHFTFPNARISLGGTKPLE